MAWYDTEKQEYRALVDLVRGDGYRTPGGAARGSTVAAVGQWVTAILLDAAIADDDIQTTELGEMAAPSFSAVRAKAALVDMQSQGAI